MSSGGESGQTSRPLSVAIPEQDSSSASGPYCPMRPRLADILANTAPPPWTLSAFMAYLSQNHCLETLEFTMDAGRYRKHYHKMLSRTTAGVMEADSSECEYLRMLWSRLLEAYIRPSGEREVNLPSDVRDELLNLPNDSIPPLPESLDLAVLKINELMEESVLYPFLNSFEEQVARNRSSTNLSTYNNPSEENLSHSSMSASHRFSSRRRPSPPPASTRDPSTSPQMTSRNVFAPRHISAPPSSGVSTSSHRSSHAAARATQASSVSSSSTPGTVGTPVESTDDSGSGDSPLALTELMTPPTTPPTSDYGGGGGDVSPPNLGFQSSGSQSPRSSRDSNAWKKGLSKLGWKKKSMHGLSSQDGVLKEEDSLMDVDS